VIKTADWIIDLGPEGGERGGEVVAAGTPEDVAAVERSYTGGFLKKALRVAETDHDLRAASHEGELQPPTLVTRDS